MNVALRELALFAGCGGGILGGKLLGWHTVCAVEIESYPRKVLLQRQRDGILERFPIWDDIKTFDGRPWRGAVDIITGGFPCQDISFAGKRTGITGAKSGLWREMARVVREVIPRFVFVENSPGLLTPVRESGKVVGSPGITVVLQDLAEMGYNARWCVLGANAAGAPHDRERAWILAYTDSQWKLQQKGIKPEKRGWTDNINKKGSKEMAYADSQGLEKRESEYGNHEQKFKAVVRDGCEWWQTDPADLPDTFKIGLQGEAGKQEQAGREELGGSYWRATQSRVVRLANGISHRVDRIKALGNAQVPSVAALAFVILSQGLI